VFTCSSFFFTGGHTVLHRLLSATLLAVVVAVSGCASGLPRHLEGDLFTQCRMDVVGGRIYTHPVTDAPAETLPVGLKVRIERLDAKAIVLEDEAGRELTLRADKDQPWRLETLTLWISKFVDPNPPKGTDALALAIKKGAPEAGMWRDDVILAVGWPSRIGISGPANNLPRDKVLQETMWRVNTKSKGETLRAIEFSGNKVVKVE